jgi:MFS family permease
VFALTCAASCLLLGAIADRAPVAVMTRVAALLYVAGCPVLMAARSVLTVCMAAAISGLGSAAFWPSIQGQVGREAPPGRSDSTISRFSVSWALGKAIGCAGSGYIFA